MNKFFFEAANQDGNKVSGHLVAENIEQARSILKEKKFAIFSLVTSEQKKIAATQEKNENLISFEFEGLDKIKNPVHGHISATNLGVAYKTLKLNYSYSIEYLVDDSLPQAKKEEQKKSGIPQELIDWFEIEAIKEKKKNKSSVIVKKETKEVKLTPEEKEKVAQLQNEVSKIVQQSFELLSANEEVLDPLKKREIVDRLNLLSRLKRSNAIDHLKTLTAKVLDEIQDDAIFLKNLGQDNLFEKKEEFKLFSDERGIGLQKKVLELPIDIDFDSIDLDVLKVKLKRAKIIRNSVRSVYEFFIIETALLTLFFIIISFLIGLFNNEVLGVYLESSTLWGLFYFSLLVVLIFMPLYRKNNYKLHQFILYIISGTLFFTFALLQFHGIFFWTT